MGWIHRSLVLIAFTAHLFVAVAAQALPVESSEPSRVDQGEQAAVHAPDHAATQLFTLSREGDSNVGVDRTRTAPSPLDRLIESAGCVAATAERGFSLVAHCDRHACRSSLAFFGRLIPLRN